MICRFIKIFILSFIALASSAYPDSGSICPQGGDFWYQGCLYKREADEVYKSSLAHPTIDTWFSYISSSGCPIIREEQTYTVCKILRRYSLGDPNGSPPPKTCDHNPIELSSGAKIQREVDVEPRGPGQIKFERFYNNTTPSMGESWFFSYGSRIDKLESDDLQNFKVLTTPSTYNNKPDICWIAWDQFKLLASDPELNNASAQYVDDSCQVIKGGVVIKTLAIVPENIVDKISLEAPVQLHRDNGSVTTFRTNGIGGVYYSNEGEHGTLIKTTFNGMLWRYLAENGDIEDYLANGKLASITNSSGMKTTLFYDSSGVLTKVQDGTGRKLIFNYVGTKLAGLSSDDGKTTTYTYNALGLIESVTRPDNSRRIYHYENINFPKSLTGITDERGVRYATWAYDGQGRAITSQHANGADSGTVTFNADGSTTSTNVFNKQTIYRFSYINGARRVTSVEGQPTANCSGANKNYTYTPEGWLASKTDWKGNKTTYQYNAKGQEILRTEAEGTPVARIIKSEWDPTLNLKVKVTEPDKETAYTYNENGVITKQTVKSTNVQ